MSMTQQQLKNIVEAALLAADQPLSVDRLLKLFEPEECADKEVLRAAIEDLETDCAERGIELKEVGSGFRLQVKPSLGKWVSRLWDEKPPRYSRALLETLALIAYRQPITRGEIEEIRGVAVSSHIIKTLQEREWIRVLGHRDVPGKPALFGTARQFLDYFNIKSLEELPPLAEIRNLDEIKIPAELEETLAALAADQAAQEAAEGAVDADIDQESAEFASAAQTGAEDVSEDDKPDADAAHAQDVVAEEGSPTTTPGARLDSDDSNDVDAGTEDDAVDGEDEPSRQRASAGG